MQGQLSQIKNTALTLLNVIDDLAQPRITNGVVRKFWNWFFVSHGKNVVITMQDAELKDVMRAGYDALKPIYEKAELSNQLKEARQLNDPSMTAALEKMPKFREIAEFMP